MSFCDPSSKRYYTKMKVNPNSEPSNVLSWEDFMDPVPHHRDVDADSLSAVLPPYTPSTAKSETAKDIKLNPVLGDEHEGDGDASTLILTQVGLNDEHRLPHKANGSFAFDDEHDHDDITNMKPKVLPSTEKSKLAKAGGKLNQKSDRSFYGWTLKRHGSRPNGEESADLEKAVMNAPEMGSKSMSSFSLRSFTTMKGSMTGSMNIMTMKRSINGSFMMSGMSTLKYVRSGVNKVRRNIAKRQPYKSAIVTFDDDVLKRELNLPMDIVKEYERFGFTYCLVLGMEYHLLSNELQGMTRLDPLMQASDSAAFKVTREEEFPPNGKLGKPCHKLTKPFTVREYAPRAFAQIRHLYSINNEQFLKSFTGETNLIRFSTNSKSGSYFYFTRDGEYVVKTVTAGHTRAIMALLPFYFEHVHSYPDTLIMPMFGLFYVHARHLNKRTCFLITKSAYAKSKDVPIHSLYDLKGATSGRRAKPGESIKKDLDFMDSEKALYLGPYRPQFLSQLKKDLRFLSQHNLMDYSLLIGIHDMTSSRARPQLNSLTGEFEHLRADISRDENFQKFPRADSITGKDFLYEDGLGNDPLEKTNPEKIGRLANLRSVATVDGVKKKGYKIYYFGLIDFVQEYNTKKKFEHKAKGFLKGHNKISAVPSAQYAKRLFSFMAERIHGDVYNKGPNDHYFLPTDVDNASESTRFMGSQYTVRSDGGNTVHSLASSHGASRTNISSFHEQYNKPSSTSNKNLKMNDV